MGRDGLTAHKGRVDSEPGTRWRHRASPQRCGGHKYPPIGHWATKLPHYYAGKIAVI